MPYQRTMHTRTTWVCRVRGHAFDLSTVIVEFEDGTSAPLCQRSGCNHLGERKDRRVPTEEVVRTPDSWPSALSEHVIQEEP